MGVRDQILSTIRVCDDWIFERVGGQKLLFVTTDGYGFACQAPVIRKLLASGHTGIRVTADPGDRLDGPLTFESPEHESLFNKLRIPASVASVRKWHVVIYSHGCGFYPRRHALRAYATHGSGFNRPEAVQTFDLSFGLSRAEHAHIEQCSPGTYGPTRAFFPIGYPATDSLVNGGPQAAAILASLNLPIRRTIVIASRWEPPHALLFRLGATPFELLAREFPDCNVIQHGHPWLWQHRRLLSTAWQDGLYKSLRDIERQYSNARFLPEESGARLVSASDLLVADTTSTVTIAALLDRAVVLCEDPALPIASRADWAPYLNAGEVFSELEDLPELCRQALADPDKGRQGRAVVKETFFAHPGRAAAEMARTLVDIGTVCSTSSSGWARVLDLSERALAQP